MSKLKEMNTDQLRELREHAYQIWRGNGQNMTDTRSQLIRQGFVADSISKQRLWAWRKKFEWDERAAKSEFVADRIMRGAEPDQLLYSLLLEKENYEKWREDNPGKIEPQITHGYTSVISKIADIQIKLKPQTQAAIDRPKLFLEGLEFVAEVLKETDPEGLRVLSKNYEMIIERYKEKYA